ncbi:DEAD/DEAH box helicase family protein, partial [Halomonas sp. MM17-34]|uniref:DEAD/DEAH box helicase family protein n=1 Tax=Halomonas sp. MM17-34 TaxID=2917742 RepID=UPI001EF5ED67
TTAPVALKAAIEEGTAPAEAIARSVEHLEMPSRGLLFIDVDDGQEPQAIIDHLTAFDESMKGVKWLALGSSRYHVTDKAGRTVTQKSGWHLYALAEGLEHLNAYAKAYEAWARGAGYAKQVTDEAGRKRWVYPIDTATWKTAANRLIFESVALPSGYKAEKPRRWINPEGTTATIQRPVQDLLTPKRQRRTAELEALSEGMDVPELLERLGYRHAGGDFWYTPNQKETGASAQYFPKDGKVFHYGKELNNKNLDALGLIAHWEYNNDYKAAAAALRASRTDEKRADLRRYSARCNLESMKPAAQRHMTAYIQSEDDYWLGMAALYDGVEQQVTLQDWCKQHAQMPSMVARAMDEARRALWGGQHQAKGVRFTRHDDISKAAAAISASSASAYLKAPLGAGKTEKVLAPLIEQHHNVLIINHLRALSNDLASRLKAQHYQQAMPLTEGRLVTTVHSLGQPRVTQWLRDEAPTLVVIDEAASVADVLGQPGGNLSDTQQTETLHLLQKLAQMGTRFVLADGDCPEAAVVLAGLLNVKEWHRAPGNHQQPRIEIHQGVSVTTVDSASRIRKNPTHPLSEAIRASKSLALCCDTLTDVEAWAGRLGCLGIHGKNSGDPEQAAFLVDPDSQAPRLDRVVYNSVLGAGVSITSTEREVVGVYTGHLPPRSLWQALRRWRRAADNVIKIQTGPGTCLPKRQQAVTDSIDWLACLHDLDGLPGVGSPVHGWQALRAAYCAEVDRWTRNPQQALLTYLKEAGLEVSVIVDPSASTDPDHDAAKQDKKAERLKAFAEAAQVTDKELARIRRQPRKTSKEAAQERRGIAERTLHLDNSDLTPAGHIREPLAKQILHKQLERRAGLASYLWIDGNIASEMDAVGGRGMHHHHRWRIVRTTMKAVGIDPLAPEAIGRPFTRLDVLDLVKQLDSMLPTKGRLPLLRAMGLPELPRPNASSGKLTAWARDWFTRVGLTRAERTKVTIEGQRIDASRWRLDLLAACFGQRIAAHKNGTFGGRHLGSSNPAESHASRAFQVSPVFSHTLYTWGSIGDTSQTDEVGITDPFF